MAEDKDTQQTGSNASTNTFSKGMMKDVNESFVGEGMYTHARNAVNNSHDGQVGIIGNEPSTFECITFPYTLIGAIHLEEDKWAIFTTNNINSEIGEFDESECSYRTIVSDVCLNFKTTNLITGAYREKYDCQRVIYWDDGLNPTRTMNIDNIPWIQNCTTLNSCTTCVDTNRLDCEKIRIAALIDHPCISIKKGEIAGTLANGSYQACVAYTVNQVRVTDYISLTDVQGLFSHDNTNSSLEIKVTNLDPGFDEFELVVIANVNAQTVAKRIGYYSISQGTIFVDRIDNTSETVPLSDIVLRAEPIEKTDAMYPVNDYLLRVGVYSKFKFNYQPLANQIVTEWAAVQYPADYYAKANHNTGYMRDEVYAFFIRFIYNTGEFSESYHIPGRPSTPFETILVTGGDDVFPGEPARRSWQIYNTAVVTNTTTSTLPDGGVQIASGKMAYWESTEKYPDNRPDIWDSFPNNPGSPLNLCGKAIRHHKMPDESSSPILSTYNNTGKNIVVLGVKFGNIKFPVDENGNPITSIVGYQILRGSREGNKSIIAKGLINNMREYDIPSFNGPTRKGLYQNYPYNDRRPYDNYFIPAAGTYRPDGTNGRTTVPLAIDTPPRKDFFTFHSPDTTFNNPYLSLYELTIYQQNKGKAYGRFISPYKHPKFKLLTDFSSILTRLVGIISGISTLTNGVQLAATEDIPLGTTIRGFAAIPIAAFIGKVASEQVTKLIVALVPKRQYALQYVSHGFYNESELPPNQTRRRQILQSNYIDDNIQQFTLDTTTSTAFTINNLNRGKTVALRVGVDIQGPTSTDTSRFILSDTNQKQLNVDYESDISSYYAGLKISIPSQYGQLDSIRQLPISQCSPVISPARPIPNSSVIFNGDVYINRFTEKNTMFFFNDWLMGQVDQFEYDYTKYFNIPYPRFWVNNTEYHSFFKVASDYRILDLRNPDEFFIKSGYFYLFNSGVRDFFVESEVNVAYRDWEDTVEKRHYDPNAFSDLDLIFRSDLIRAGNYYKYDYSLSVTKLFSSNISWGSILPRDYDPEIAATCFTYRPGRVIYSLAQQDESKKDNWRVYLINNYRDFPSSVSSIKSVNKNGALFMLRHQSPLQFLGVDQLQTDTGTKITLGDGGLFSQPFQSLVNTDDAYEYGSNQGNYCSVNTTFGLFWVSQNQGKVFHYGGSGLDDITNSSMKWWFSRYLPSFLLKTFPEYRLHDNPVQGVGVQAIYDNTNDVLYITKKDYKPKRSLWLDPSNNIDFYTDATKTTPAPFTNTNFWEPSNFTISYDPKIKVWVSFHDWIPSFVLPGRNHFMSVAKKPGGIADTIWKHNIRCDSYCNFYGIEYPFEIEFVSSTGQQVASMRNLEYLLEVYNYYNDCNDKFHVLDQNFDQAMVYNSEQVSGVLELSLKSKSNPLQMLTYPQIGTNSIRIQFSKEENKYRFNQFWDITKDRGEFSGANLPMFITEANGYRFTINPGYVDYNKPPLQRKKFRHYVNRVFLRKHISGKNKFLFKVSNEKLLQSPR